MQSEFRNLFEAIRAGRIDDADARLAMRRLSARSGRRFSFRSNDPYVRDHVIDGEPVVIGVTHVALSIETFLNRYPEAAALALRNVQFVKPVVAPEGGEATLRVDLAEDGDFIVRHCTSVDSSWRLAAKGSAGSASAFWTSTDFSALADSLPSVSVEQIYEANSSVVWGSGFRTILQTRASETEAVLKLSLPPWSSEGFDPSACPLDPRLINGGLYAAFAVMERRGVPCAFLPLSITRLTANVVRAAGPFWIHARLVRVSGEMATFDVDFADASGQTIARYEGFGLKRMRRPGAPERTVAWSGQTDAGDGPAAEDSPEMRTGVVRAYLAGAVEQVLGRPVEDGSRNFLDIGFDSAGLVALAERIRAELKIDLFPPLFFEYPSLDELTGYFVGTHHEAVARHVSTVAQHVASSATGDSVENTVALVAARAIRPPVSDRDAPIAIIGMDGRFARSPDIGSFWRNLLDGRDLVTEVPPDRWPVADWFDADRAAPHKTYCKWGSFLDDISAFDPLFFGVSPQQATWLDPQVRLLMEVAYGAAEDAGYASNLRGSTTGVYAGACFQEYWDEIIRNRIALTGYEHPSSHRSSIAAHVSYGLDLRGPSVPVDNACASSLTALHLACQALRQDECDMALACGVNLLISPLQFVYFSRIQAMSPTGRCHAFDRRADGFIPGEGAVALLLKPLARAERDGDNIHAVVLGSAINHTGRSPNPTAPRPELQTEVLRTAWQRAGIQPEQLSYVECHGTGTQLGDPIEVGALRRAFGEPGAARLGRCVLGSVKAHIGHLEGAAGLAGVVMLIESMRHRTLPRMPGFNELNPMINLDGSPFRINRENEPWGADGGPLIGGVSGFGMTGNGAHIVLGSYDRSPAPHAEAQPAVIVLSARDKERLRALAVRMRDFLSESPADLRLADLAYTLQVGRESFEERLGFVADDLSDARATLDKFIAGASHKALCARAPRGARDGRVVGAESVMQERLKAWLAGAAIDWTTLAAPDPAKPRRISLPCYPFARERYWFPRERVNSAPGSEAVTGASPPADLSGLIFEPVWRSIESTPRHAALAPRRALIVAADGSAALAGALAARLRAHRTLRLEDLAESEDMEAALGAAAEVDALFFLAAGSVSTGTEPDGAVAVQTLLRLAQHIHRSAGARDGVDCFLVSQTCQPGVSPDGDPAAAGVIGLGYALAQGEARFRVRNVGVAFAAHEGAAHEALVTAILDEPSDPRGDLVYLDGIRRLRRRFAPVDLPPAEPAFRTGGLYVIVGGGGVVGSVVTRHLLDTYDAHVVWIGRTPAAEMADRLQSCSAGRGRLDYEQADVTLTGELACAVENIRREHGAINGAMFASVVFTFSNALMETTVAEFDAILKVKTCGARAFHEAFAGVPLDFLCFFSSSQAFAFSSAARLAGYAAGIAYADSYASAIAREAKFPVLIINWGFWRAITQGDLWRRYKTERADAAQEKNIGFLEDTEGVACLERILAEGRRRGSWQVACLRPSAAVRKLMQVDGPIDAPSRPIDDLEKLPASACGKIVAPASGGAVLRELVVNCLAVALQLAPNRIADDMPFADYGIDSITSAGLVAHLGREIGCEVGATVVYDYPTVTALTAHLETILPAETRRRVSGEADAEPHAPTATLRRDSDAPAVDAKAIAVIGMSLQAPGAQTPEEFWRLLDAGEVVTGPIPPERFTDSAEAARYASARAGVLDERDVFDPLFFNISPREAQEMSPYQRLMLQEAWRCLESAGVNPKSLAETGVGVFIGAEPPSFARASLTGGSEALIAARISYFLNFRGPAIVINTGCSASAMALHLACESLRHGESDLALAGGVFADIGPDVLRLLSGIGMLSPSGVCRPFDAAADGAVLSEAAGLVALKRLADAIRDGDPVRGVILHSAANQDGASNGITAPNGRAQEALLRKVYGVGGIDAATIGFVEAHGTGTNLGDPIEVNALSQVFGAAPPLSGDRALGSVKANLGHASAAAGVVGLIKTLLCLQHERIPALPGFVALNPKIRADGFRIDGKARPWPRTPGLPRRAGISSFGHSGTNVHLVIEEAPEPTNPPATAGDASFLIPISAPTPALLRVQAERLLDYLRNAQHGDDDLPALAWTLQTGRAALDARAVFVARSMALLDARLVDFIDGRPHAGCWSGLRAPGGRAESARVLRWIAERDQDALAAFWADGGDVDWTAATDRPPRRLALPTSPFDRRYFPVSCRDAAGINAYDPPTTEETSAPIWLPLWRPLPTAPRPAPLDPQPVVVFATAAGAALARTIAARETALGSSVSLRDPDAVAELASGPPPGRIYFLAWVSAPFGEAPPEPALELALLAVLKALRRRATDQPVDLFILTRSASPLVAAGTEELRGTGVAGAGAAGLAYALAQSDHRLRVRNIDLDADDPAIVEALMAEPPSNRGNRIKLRVTGRFGQTFSRLATPAGGVADGLRRGGVYLIAGGAGTVGRVISHYLHARYGARTIWLGRSAAGSEKVRGGLASTGGAALYIQADVTDPAALGAALEEIKARGLVINGAIFSGLAFEFDDTLDRATPETFRRIFDVKMAGGLNFYSALAEEPLDFLCYFSSSQAFSFSGATQFCSYAAAMAAADSLVHRLRAQASFPVGIINWGFWRSSAENARLGPNIAQMTDSEGCEAFRAFIDQLRAGRLTQAASFNPADIVRDLMPGARQEVHFAPPSPVVGDSVVFASPSALRALIAERQPPDFDAWAARILLHRLRDLGAFSAGALNSVAEMASAIGAQAKYHRWLGEALEILAQQGILGRCDGGWVCRAAAEPDVEARWRSYCETARRDSRWASQVELLDACLDALPRVLHGDLAATDVLFPKGSLALVEGVYSRNPLFDFLNILVADAANRFLDARSAAETDRRATLRLAEIGAGTGGTTCMTLPRLGRRPDVAEYLFTDLSRSFLINAETRFGRDYPCLRTRLWNVERDPATQDIETGAFDVVIATNVLHATRDIRETLRHAKAALREGGVLLINEITKNSVFGTLTFGLLDGWWLYDDDHLRIPGTPLLAPETWREVLRESGFRCVDFLAGEAESGGFHAIRAVSDGMILPPPALPAPPPSQPPPRPALTPEPVQTGDATGAIHRARTAIIKALGESLNIPTGDISVYRAMSEYGVDSILGIHFIDLVNRRLGLALNPAVVFEYGTVARLAAHAAELSPAEPALPVDPPRPAPTVVAQPAQAPIKASGEEPIAIIGMSGQFPDAGDVDTFWRNLVAGRDSVHELPASYLAGRRPEMMRFRWGGALADRDCFDPLFFAITPREAESMSPHQRLVLQECWRALEDAAIDPRRLDGARVGLYIGAEPAGYLHESFIGQSDALVASRPAYFLNLRGPAMAINTGCSSSGVALHLACESLRRNETTLAIAGGVCANLDHAELMNLMGIGMFSPTGRCRSFSVGADGAVMSEAVAVVVLKRLSDALRDGDPLHAVIVASGINQDGASNGVTAPNGEAQEELIRDTYRRFAIDPREIDYVEAHGTGTPLGDVVEAHALARVFAGRPDNCLLGSAKSHVGHSSAASAAVGLIKLVLSLRHATIPGNLHFEGLNPLIDAATFPFRIPTVTRAWPRRDGRPRVAALSSFGHSGTNAHLVVREVADLPTSPADAPVAETPALVPLSARNEAQLRKVAARLAAALAPSAPPISGALDELVAEELGALLGIAPLELGRAEKFEDLGATPAHLAQLRERLERRLSHVIDDSVFGVTRAIDDVVAALPKTGRDPVAPSGTDAPSLASVALTLQQGRKPLASRAIFLVSCLDDLREKLTLFADSGDAPRGSWVGQADAGADVAMLFAEDADLGEAVIQWLRKGKLDKVADLWRRGFDVPWEALPQPAGARRLHLPAYPFVRETYRKPPSASSALAPASSTLGSALLHENLSTLLRQRFVSRLTGGESFLEDHRVDDRKVLPAAAIIEIARAAVTLAAERPSAGLTFRNLCWAQPVVVADAPSRIETTVARRVPDDGDGSELLIEIRDDREALVFSADALWGDSGSFCLETTKLRRAHPITADVDVLYSAIAATGVNLGPAHKGIRALNVAHAAPSRTDSCVAEIVAPQPATETAGAYGLHPGLIDAALQTIISLQPAGRRPMLPYAVDRLEIHKLPAAATMLVWARRADGADRFDLDLADAAGDLCVAIRGLACRSSPAAADALTGPVLLAPIWEATPVAESFTPAAGVVLFCGAEAEARLWSRRLVRFSPATLTPSPDLSIDDMLRRLDDLSPPDCIVWAAPGGTTAGGAGNDPHATVVPLFRFLKALLRKGWDAKPLTWIVLTRRGAALPGDGPADAAHAALHGFVGSVAKESPDWRFKVIDLPAEAEADPAPEHMFGLPGDTSGDPWAWRGGEWLRLSLAPVMPTEPVDDVRALPRQGSLTVIIGGAGGIGVTWSERMIRSRNARVVWIGRRPMDAAIRREIDRLAEMGPAPDYVQADAGDAIQLRAALALIRERHGPAHGLIHSAIVLSDQTVLKMTEEQLRAALRPKVDVAVAMAEVFAAEPLEFVAFFSSVQSFLKMPGQGNYAAGSCFVDAFATQLRRLWSCPVKVMNWGYWGDVGIVASADYRRRMAEAGMGSIAPDSAIEALDFLFDGPLDQIALMTSERPLGLPGVATAQRLRVATRGVRGLLDELRIPPPPPGPEADYLRAGGDYRMAEMEPFLRDILREQLADLGLTDAAAPSAQLPPGAPAYLQRWLRCNAAFLEAGPAGAASLDEAWQAWDGARAEWIAHPSKRAQVILVEKVMRALPDILSGRRSAPSVMFPDSSLHLVESVYKENLASRYFNLSLAEAFAAVVARLAREGEKLRILEIGAGTGGTSIELFRVLVERGLADSVAEYLYTDISNAFLAHAQDTYAARAPYLRTRRVDIDQPLAAQKVDEGVYDIVIAANSLHATRNIRRAVRHVKSALKEGGVALFNEISGASLYAHLTFGLLEGWWLFDDPALRLPGCPGLSPAAWTHVLRTEGFGAPLFPSSQRHDLGLQIIVAASDGVVRTTSRQLPKPEAPESSLSAPPPRRPAAATADLSQRVAEHLTRLIAEVTRIPLAEIDAATPLEAYGVDSIVVIQLAKALRKLLPEASATLFFEHQSIDALARHLAGVHAKQLTEALAAPTRVEPTPRPAPALASPKPPTRAQAKSQTRIETEPQNHSEVWSQSQSQSEGPALVRNDSGARAPRRVAVVGIAGRYPGAATLDDFWDNLAQGRNCVGELPVERWNWRDYYEPTPGAPGALYTGFGGFLSEIDCFDPLFFGISPVEAEAMNPQERLFLETAWACIEDAGHTPETLSPRRRVGVFVGVMNDTYHCGAKHWSVANRVSYHADFRGPSVAVDTACSSSLTALHLALQSILDESCDCALAGGVNIIANPLHSIKLSTMRVLSPDARNKTFSAEANGFVDGEGVGVVLLKPLDAAIADGDHVYGVILASAINAGGKVNGYTVPNPNAQASLVSDALERAAVDARTISYVEAHGTGTALGDPIEIAGLTVAFRRHTEATGFCAIGSVKSNIGHGESAAGVAGLTKILMQMRRGRLVPSLHAEPPNIEIDFARSPFRVQTELAVWEKPTIAAADGTLREHPRRAGLSSFGAGGANAHVIVEEYPDETPAAGDAPAVAALLPLSARTPDQLRAIARQLCAWLSGRAAAPIHDVAFTLQRGRLAFEHRLAIVAADAGATIASLNAWLDGAEPPDGLFQGHVRAANVASADRDVADGQEPSITDDLAAIARAWTAGRAVEWPRASGRRRVSLPTYPFARERYWNPELPYPPPRADRRELRRVFDLSGGEAFLRDHKVGGMPVMPGVAYLELARQASEQELGQRPTSFFNVVWVSPFTVDSRGAALQCRIEPKGDRDSSFAFTSERGGETILHCKGAFRCGETLARPPSRSPAELAGAPPARRVGPVELQAAFRRMGVEYGRTHLLLGPVSVGATTALAPIAPETTARVKAASAGDSLPPGLLDSAFQACLCLIDGALDAAAAMAPPLPFGLSRLEIYGPCETVRWVAASRRQSDAGRIEVDLDLLSEDGDVRLRFLGLTSQVQAKPRQSVAGRDARENGQKLESLQESLQMHARQHSEARMDELIAQLVRASLPARAEVRPFYAAWLDQTDRWLDGVPASRDAPEALWSVWRAQRDGWLADPRLRPRIALLEAALPALGNVLTGTCAATDVLFPKGSLALVEPVYNANPVADAFNDRLVDSVVAWIQARARPDAGGAASIRVLEIGAGTGGTSRRLLRALRPFRDHISEYCFTDRSHFFLREAERVLGPDYPFLRCQLLDIDQPVAEQGILAGGYDLVIAANVLHATRNMRRTVAHVRSAMREGGLLALNELAGNALYAHVTFGLLEGWWGYDDAELRLPGSPGLAPAAWRSVLEAEGFAEIAFPATDLHELGQQIVTASAGHRAGDAVADGETMRRFVRDVIRKHVARSLKLDDSRLEDDRSFSDYGVDSILAVNLVNDIADSVDAPLTTTVLFDHNTVERLTRHIIESHPATVRKIVGGPATAAERSPDSSAAEAPAPASLTRDDPQLCGVLQAFEELDPRRGQVVLLLSANPEACLVANFAARERGVDLIVGAGESSALDNLRAEGVLDSLAFHASDFSERLFQRMGDRRVDHIICALADAPDELLQVLSHGGQWLDLD